MGPLRQSFSPPSAWPWSSSARAGSCSEPDRARKVALTGRFGTGQRSLAPEGACTVVLDPAWHPCRLGRLQDSGAFRHLL